MAGEAAVQAYYAVSQHQPGMVALLSASMTHSFIEPDDHRMIWEAISFGTQVGLAGVFLEGCRWEQGWERPLAEWRSELLHIAVPESVCTSSDTVFYHI